LKVFKYNIKADKLLDLTKVN